MKHLKKMKSKIACILTIAFLLPTIYSCTSEKVELESQRAFDLTISKEGIKVVNTLPKVDYKKYKSGEVIDKIGLTNAINNQVGENVLNSTVFDFSNSQNKTSETDFDTEILQEFSSDWETVGINQAIINLNSTLNEKNVDDIVFEKYNNFSNVLLLSEVDLQNQTSNYQAKSGWGCAFAIANFTLATVAVGTTCVPNPVTIYACPIAAGRAVLAYASMLVACAD